MIWVNEAVTTLQTIISRYYHFGKEVSLQKRQSSGCASTVTGTYEVVIVYASSTPKYLPKEATCDPDALVIALDNGILTDAGGRIGGITDNGELQFLYPSLSFVDSSWSLCPGQLLAHSSSTSFFECLLGDSIGIFDESINPNCTQVTLQGSACSKIGATQLSSTINTASLMILIPTVSSASDSKSTVATSLTLSASDPAATVTASPVTMALVPMAAVTTFLTPSTFSTSLTPPIPSTVSLGLSSTTTITTSPTSAMASSALSPTTTIITASTSSSSPSYTKAGISSSTMIGVSVGFGLSGSLLIIVMLLWLIMKKKMTTRKLLASKSEPGIAVDYEP